MSKIPYIFETPIPKYFREHGWMKNPNMCAFVFWCFCRCSAEKHVVYHIQKAIELDPFEFIFGRRVCSLETGLTEREIRTCIDQLNTSSLGEILKKTTSKTTNKFSVYKWSTNIFNKNYNQQHDQQTTSRRPADDHKQEQENIAIKEQQEQAPLSVVCSFSCLNGFGLSDADIQKLCQFPEIDVIRAVQVRNEYKKPVDSEMGYLLKAIMGKWQPKSNPKISLSEKAEKNKSEIFRYASWDRDKLKIKDIEIIDKIDHVLFGCDKIYYESDNFGKEVGKCREKFNLIEHTKAIDKNEFEEKIINFKQAGQIALGGFKYHAIETLSD